MQVKAGDAPTEAKYRRVKAESGRVEADKGKLRDKRAHKTATEQDGPELGADAEVPALAEVTGGEMANCVRAMVMTCATCAGANRKEPAVESAVEAADRVRVLKRREQLLEMPSTDGEVETEQAENATSAGQSM